MTLDDLEFALDSAIAEMSKQCKNIVERANENEPLPKIIDSTFESMADCLITFKEKIIDYEKQKG